jgi:hypothetical protein
MPCGAEVSPQVHSDDRVEILRSGVVDHAVTQDAGVVDQDVQATELLDRLRYQGTGPVEVRDIVVVGHRPSARGDDLVDHLLRRALVIAATVPIRPQVVHDHGRTGTGQRQRLTTTDTTPGPGDHGHLAR